MLLWVFCFQWYSDDFTESHDFVGTFVGMWLPVESTYQQIWKDGSNELSDSWLSNNDQYNSNYISSILFEAKESVFVAVNKWRDFCAGRLACQHLVKTIRFSARRKTIHLAVNPYSEIRANCTNRQWLVHFFQLKKEVNDEQSKRFGN